MDRRESLKALSLGGLAITAANSWALEPKSNTKEIFLSAGDILPRPLTFDSKNLTGLSEKLIQSH